MPCGASGNPQPVPRQEGRIQLAPRHAAGRHHVTESLPRRSGLDGRSTSRFSYLNYCKQQGRLYNYYIRENWYLSRQEFDRYCKWAAARLDNLRYQHDVQEVWYDESLPGYVLAGVRGDTGEGFQYRCRKLVIGIGGVPHIPVCCSPGDARQAVHTSGYLDSREALQRCRSITVIGSGQSGAEVFQDLLEQARSMDTS